MYARIVVIDIILMYRIFFPLKVVDARAGPGIKSSMKIKNKLSPTHNKYKSPLRSKKSSYSAVAGPGTLYDDLSGKAICSLHICIPLHAAVT